MVRYFIYSLSKDYGALTLLFALQDRLGLQYVVLTGQSDWADLMGSLSLDVCCAGGQLRHR